MTPAIRKQAEIILCMHRLSLAEPIDRMVPEHTQDRFNITSDCCLEFSTRLEGGESGWSIKDKSCWFKICIPTPNPHPKIRCRFGFFHSVLTSMHYIDVTWASSSQMTDNSTICSTVFSDWPADNTESTKFLITDALSISTGLLQRQEMRKAFLCHDDVIKWKHFPRFCPFVSVTGEFPQKGQWRFDVFFDLRLNKQLSK